MRSSSRTLRFAAAGVGLSVLIAGPGRALAQQPVPAQGFALERFYPAAPGGGWMVMDALDMRGGLGGAVAFSTGYAHDSLRVTDGVTHVPVVSDQAFFDVALAITYDHLRLYMNLDSPIVDKGESGTVGAYSFAGPQLDISTRPDTISDVRVGLDSRIVGGAKSPFRLGAGAQLYVPSGSRADYLSDGNYRAMLRLLAAGDYAHFTYAAQLGVHIRSLDDTPVPGSPRGSEVLFGVAGGPRFDVDAKGETVIVVGPEIYGESALASFGQTTLTGVEGLLTGRIEGTGDDGPQIQAKLGVGAGLNPHFGAPEWRCVFAISVFDHSTDTDGDGVYDAKDACPNVPGRRTTDPKTNGCPADRDGDSVPDATDVCPDSPGAATTDPGTNGCATEGTSTDGN